MSLVSFMELVICAFVSPISLTKGLFFLLIFSRDQRRGDLRNSYRERTDCGVVRADFSMAEIDLKILRNENYKM